MAQATFVRSADDGQNVFGNWRTVVGVYTGPSSYASGGDPITPTTFGLSDIRMLIVAPALDPATVTAYQLVLNPAKTKLIWYDYSNGMEVPANTTLNTYSANILAVGR